MFFWIFAALVAFLIWKRWADQKGLSRITAALINSSRSNGETIALPYASNNAIRKFYRRFGTTAKKYETYAPPHFYVGFVRTFQTEEYAALIVRAGNTLAVSALAPPFPFGDDALSLIGKKAFIDQIVSGMREAASTT